MARATGERETLYEQAFSFADDNLRALPATLLVPGDRLLSTCEYGHSVQFGTDARDEVCELHVLHAPAGSLVNGGASDSCLR